MLSVFVYLVEHFRAKAMCLGGDRQNEILYCLTADVRDRHSNALYTSLLDRWILGSETKPRTRNNIYLLEIQAPQIALVMEETDDSYIACDVYA